MNTFDTVVVGAGIAGITAANLLSRAGQRVALASLRQIYGEDVPDPVDYWITRWGGDPYSMGSYSYVAVGASHEDHDAMATPAGGTVHLAGEATWSTDPATVNGALLSGHRAAERILGEPIDLAQLQAVDS